MASRSRRKPFPVFDLPGSPPVVIAPDGDGDGYRVEIDGRDMAAFVTKIEVEFGPAELPKVKLTMIGGAVTVSAPAAAVEEVAES